jgi:hypothetical protein
MRKHGLQRKNHTHSPQARREIKAFAMLPSQNAVAREKREDIRFGAGTPSSRSFDMQIGGTRASRLQQCAQNPINIAMARNLRNEQAD